MRVFFNLFSKDNVGLMMFYQSVLHLPELTEKRSPIYRALDAGATELGFNAYEAYDLLALSQRQPQENQSVPTIAYATFMLDSVDAVNVVVEQTAALGGKVVKNAYATYYNEWQAVLADPEENIFRVSTTLKK